ncbi:hypothetical protein BCR44DRAFT_41213 [Catenaria anguillulae PL171]|uniref:gamma-glutamylcyclotransferase n=1 Tax=Catenaria anguillulae PL171 TaxID=765915 RepID=A0A1Y2HXC4_9FUNG|nr:hypothetical protein BCR44DRAFT_41213 [Catenaria anguillulae PL171]
MTIETATPAGAPVPHSDGITSPSRVWYLGYGSNMNPDVLTGRRRVRPARAVAVSAPGYKLTFQCPGLSYLEPCFASIDVRSLPADSHIPILHGVACDITREEFEMIRQTEGMGYAVVRINCFPVTKQDQIEFGRSMTAVTLMQVPDDRLNGHIPSKRYWNLLVQGASHHGLPESYQLWLQSIPHYQVSHIGQHIGRAITVCLCAPMFLISVIIRATWRILSRQSEPPPGLHVAFRTYMHGVWFMYEHGMRFVLGDGGSGDYTSGRRRQ